MAESSPLKATKEKTNGTKLLRLVIDGGTHVLREFLHSIHPPAKLQGVINNEISRLQNLESIGVITNSQWKTLFPGVSGEPLNSKTFDITLLCILLREVCSLKAPSTGWHKEPADGDASPEANIVRIKHHRNELCHSVSIGVTDKEFECKWRVISSALVALGLDQLEVDCLKTEPIDHDTQLRVEEEVNKWKLDIEPRVENLELGFQEIKGELTSIQSSIFDQATSELSSCLPDEVSNVFGRDKEIRQVGEAIQSGAIAAVVITGGPGFGKTTVAKEVAHELAKPENNGTVLFCSLRSKVTFDEIATEIILCIGEFHSQLPPEQKLKKWSQQLKDLKQIKQVTFVLDNVDDVLESKDRQKFVNILKDMRTLSGQKVTFVITSRTAFDDPDLRMEEFRLPSLSAEDAMKVLTSRVTDPDNLKKLSKADKLVELCGHVPLALHIVGRHLSYINQDGLIESLREKPLEVLEEGDISVKKAIKTSFDFLTKCEQEALVLMSLFPGSFNSDAAQAVIKATTDSETDHNPISILLSLAKGPLVQNLGSYRYEIHPLIQTFLKKIGQSQSSEYPQLLDRGKNLACIYFMSRIAGNAKMYWSKDKYKGSLEAFNEDRHNFEHFLQVYAQGRENQDEEIMDACKTFSDDFPQNCMYLEMCVRPRFYTEILRSLLQTFNSEIQPVYRVELLCLLGHKNRKDGNQQEYKVLMEEAEQIHSKNHAEFETKAVSEVYFLNSHIRFLSEKKDSNENERMQKETKTALNVSKKQLKSDHPQAIATLLRAGINAKRRNKSDEAKQKLNKALELCKKCLGKHFMTASAHKNIADLYLFLDIELDTCLEHYATAIKLLEDLGIGDHKESVLTLKNFAICHAKKKNFHDALKQLKKAEEIAERELEEDHKWKVLIKTELAFLHEKMGYPDQAKDVMLEGQLMGERLNLSTAKMGGKHKIQEFINRYPRREEDFPRMFSSLEGERNLFAPGRRQTDYGFGGFGRSHEEPRKPMSDFGRRGHFRADEQEKALGAIPAETLTEADLSSQNFARIQEKLRTLILKKKARNKDVLKWIDKNVSAAETKEASFIRALVTVVCEDTMDREGGHCKCNIGRLKDRKNILQRYIDDNTHLELQALYAVQALFVQLDHPPGFIKSYFDSFYDEEIVTEETFNAWESSSEEELGKGVTITASSEFFRWLRSAAEEPGEES